MGSDRCSFDASGGEASNHGGAATALGTAQKCRARTQPQPRPRPAAHVHAMHKISRTSLAALICPTAPFLAPRLLRARVPTAVPVQGLLGACYATETGANNKKKKKSPLRTTRPRHTDRTPATAAQDSVCPPSQPRDAADGNSMPRCSRSSARRASRATCSSSWTHTRRCSRPAR